VLAEVPLLDEESVAELLVLSVAVVLGVMEVMVVLDKVSVLLPVDVRDPMDVAEPVEVAEPVATPVAVPVAPEIPKLVEKLMLVGSVSSMISMVYRWELTSPAGGIWRVAVRSEAGTLASIRPESGVTGSCWSLMVTVPGEGSVHEMVKGWPAVTSNVEPVMVMALFCADTMAAHKAAIAVYVKRILVR